jgi:hypothetical protein
MPDIGCDHVLEMPAAEDEEPVEAFAADTADPPLGARSRLRCPHGRLNHPNSLGSEDLVEVANELAAAVTDQELRPNALIVQLHQQVPCLLGHPRTVGIRRDPGGGKRVSSPAR